MLLTVSKRLEFSASRRLRVPGWNEQANLAAFGPETISEYGSGRNYVAYFIFAGPVDPANGMLMNISELKERAGEVLHDGFDHKFLNQDNAAFMKVAPTVEAVARELFLRVQEKFVGASAQPVACHLSESSDRSATYYGGGAGESNYWLEFSAARRTMSPALSAAENEKQFGESTRLHGHNYRCRVTFREESFQASRPIVAYDDVVPRLEKIRAALDHRDLNHDVPELAKLPVTTEMLARLVIDRCRAIKPLHRVRLHERDDFFAEAWADDEMFLGMRTSFFAAHRLHARSLSDEQNLDLYGKCNNRGGHGHEYFVEATLEGKFDPRSGTLGDFDAIKRGLRRSVEPWQDRHLDLETKDFGDSPSTGENILRALWPRADAALNHQLVRLRVWETPNNRFTLRRT